MDNLCRVAQHFGIPLSSFPRDFHLWSVANIIRRLHNRGSTPPECTVRKCIDSHSHGALTIWNNTVETLFFEHDEEFPPKQIQTAIYKTLVDNKPDTFVADLQTKIQRFASYTVAQTRCLLERAWGTFTARNRRLLSTKTILVLYRLYCNGIPTKRRMDFGQGNAGCCYLCGTGVDSIEHWLTECPVVAQAHQNCLPGIGSRLESFLLTCEENLRCSAVYFLVLGCSSPPALN